MLNFKSEAKRGQQEMTNNLSLFEMQQPVTKEKEIPKMPFKVLEAPQLQDDFYLNLVDWSSSNTLAVGLGPAVYIWSACTSRVTRLMEVDGLTDNVTSVNWSQRGSHISIGTHQGKVQIWDIHK